MTHEPQSQSGAPLTEATRAVDAPQGGITRKGLSAGSVGLIGAIVIGISCIAPAYTLTAALGPTVSEVGTQVPGVVMPQGGNSCPRAVRRHARRSQIGAVWRVGHRAAPRSVWRIAGLPSPARVARNAPGGRERVCWNVAREGTSQPDS